MVGNFGKKVLKKLKYCSWTVA